MPWGTIKSVGLSTYMPHVKAPVWDQPTGDHIVDDVILLNMGTSQCNAVRILRELREKHIGKPYSLWLGGL